MRILTPLIACALALLAGPDGAQSVDGAAALVGGQTSYDVKPGDTLSSIGARFAVAPATLIEMNQLTSTDTLAAGQRLVIDNTHIAVANPHVSLTINIAQRLLVFFDGERARAYPITVGTQSSPTPVGNFTIISKESELGRHRVGLSLPGLGIHDTNEPSSIYAFASRGCIRLHPDDIADLFQRVSVGTAGVSIYQPVIIAVIDGRVWVEAHPDEYRRFEDAMASLREAAHRAGLNAVVDWALADEVVRQRRGRAVDVTMSR